MQKKQNMKFQKTREGPERKFNDFFFAVTTGTNSSNSSGTCLNAIAQDATSSGRVGLRCRMKSVQYRMFFEPPSSGANQWGSQIRTIVIYDRQSNGTGLVPTDFLQTDTFLSPMRLTNGDRFVVLSDKVSPSIQSSSLAGSDQVYEKIDLDAVFAGSSGVASNINTGAIYLFASCNNGTSGGVSTNIVHYYTRIRYTDE